ncbi:MAG: GNAT family N-acetyltransferase, partial [Actinomycetota bacterium]
MDATRLITPDDAPALALLLQANEEFLAPFEPARGDGYLTEPGQRAAIGGALDRYRQGTIVPHVILGETGEIAGRITLNDIVRGAFQSCHLGYWVSGTQNGRGLATAAVRHVTELAFGPL